MICATVEKIIVDSNNTNGIKFILYSQGQRAIIDDKNLIKNVHSRKLELSNFNVHNKSRMRAKKASRIIICIEDNGKLLCEAYIVGKEINITADIYSVTKICKVLANNKVFKYQIDKEKGINIKITSKYDSIGAVRIVNNIPGTSRYNFDSIRCTVQSLTISGEYSQEISGLYVYRLVNEGAESLELDRCNIKYYVDTAFKKVYLDACDTSIAEVKIEKEYNIENIIDDIYRLMSVIYNSRGTKVEIYNRTIDFSESNILYDDVDDWGSLHQAMLRTTNKWLKERMKYDIGIVCKRKEAQVLCRIIKKTIEETPIVIHGKDKWLEMIERTRKLGMGRVYDKECHFIIVEV